MGVIENIIPNGTKIKTNIGNVEAIIIGICVRGTNNEAIEYQIGYFMNGEYKTSWVQSFEVMPKIDNSKPMGFSS